MVTAIRSLCALAAASLLLVSVPAAGQARWDAQPLCAPLLDRPERVLVSGDVNDDILDLMEFWDSEDPERRILARELPWLHPRLHGPTAPPVGPVRLPGEFEPMHGLLLAYPGYSDYDSVFLDILDAALPQGVVYVLVAEESLPQLERLADRVAGARCNLRLLSGVPFDTAWIRDYGPIAVEAGIDHAFIDPGYVDDRPLDDSLPTRLAEGPSLLPVHRPELLLDGGNLLSNGAGVCFTTLHAQTVNELTEEELKAELRDYFGCEEVQILLPLAGNVIEHVDMFLAVASEDTLLVGQTARTVDPANHAVLKANVDQLRAARTRDGRPFRILRVPMPPAWHDPLNPSADPKVRSHLNLVTFNGAVLVPVYEDGLPPETVVAAIQPAFPNRRVVPIFADEVAANFGALHCLTTHLPISLLPSRERRPKPPR